MKRLGYLFVLLVLGLVLPVGTFSDARADVLCANPSGLVFMRAGCNNDETKLDPVALGFVGPPGPQGPSGRKSYYLTKGTFNGAQALGACADGYHMASHMELWNPSALDYNTILGHTRADSGGGPPANDLGWARNGGDAAGDAPGHYQANCFAWTTASPTAYGNVMRFGGQIIGDFGGPFGFLNAPSVTSCNNLHHVWCIQD